MNVVTGGTGFIGSRLVQRLTADDRSEVVVTVRSQAQAYNAGSRAVAVGDLGPDTDWSSALCGARVVVHTAARVHVMRDKATDPLAEYRRCNVQGTVNLARQAARAGVRRFVFVSSIKVNGERTLAAQRFTADDAPAPLDAYGVSKLEAELAVRAVARETGMEYVIVRPPLVYGPGVRANFLSMMRWLRAGVPLPLGAIRNSRSLVALDNLVDFLAACMSYPAAANQTLLVSDGEDLSTTDLLRKLGVALHRPARLIPVPPVMLIAAASLLGQRDLARRLVASLRVDIGKSCLLLGWKPPISVDQALHQVAEGYLGGEADF